MTTLPIAPQFRRAIYESLAIQLFISIFLLLILDGGLLARAGGYAMIGYWIGVVVILMRRPKQPSSIDLLYIRVGFLFLLTAAILLWILLPL
jgi:hypothetical protein